VEVLPTAKKPMVLVGLCGLKAGLVDNREMEGRGNEERTAHAKAAPTTCTVKGKGGCVRHRYTAQGSLKSAHRQVVRGLQCAGEPGTKMKATNEATDVAVGGWACSQGYMRDLQNCT
jgi:hypothetical protein